MNWGHFAKIRRLVCLFWIAIGVASVGAVQIDRVSAQPAEEEWQLRVNNVHDLYAVDITLTFDASVIEVIDADAERPGVEIVPGPLFEDQSHFVVYNRVTVDEGNKLGYIEFVVTLLNPAKPINGAGTIAIVPYHVIDPSAFAASPFTIEEARLARFGGYRILVEWQDNTIWEVFRTYLPLITRSDAVAAAGPRAEAGVNSYRGSTRLK